MGKTNSSNTREWKQQPTGSTFFSGERTSPFISSRPDWQFKIEENDCECRWLLPANDYDGKEWIMYQCTETFSPALTTYQLPEKAVWKQRLFPQLPNVDNPRPNLDWMFTTIQIKLKTP